jgi:hypothetical protein
MVLTKSHCRLARQTCAEELLETAPAPVRRRTANKVWPKGSTPPIVFMGLLDTVGAVGLPRISGVGAKPLTYDYVSLRDLAVSTEVQNVFQACSTHDRLTPFEPCFVRRSEQYDHNCLAIVDKLKADRIAQDAHQPEYNGVQYTTEEVWYPGEPWF